jgi:hypothetical protein
MEMVSIKFWNLIRIIAVFKKIITLLCFVSHLKGPYLWNQNVHLHQALICDEKALRHLTWINLSNHSGTYDNALHRQTYKWHSKNHFFVFASLKTYRSIKILKSIFSSQYFLIYICNKVKKHIFMWVNWIFCKLGRIYITSGSCWVSRFCPSSSILNRTQCPIPGSVTEIVSFLWTKLTTCLPIFLPEDSKRSNF